MISVILNQQVNYLDNWIFSTLSTDKLNFLNLGFLYFDIKFLAHCQQSSGLIARADYLRSKTGEATLTLYGQHFCLFSFFALFWGQFLNTSRQFLVIFLTIKCTRRRAHTLWLILLPNFFFLHFFCIFFWKFWDFLGRGTGHFLILS